MHPFRAFLWGAPRLSTSLLALWLIPALHLRAGEEPGAADPDAPVTRAEFDRVLEELSRLRNEGLRPGDPAATPPREDAGRLPAGQGGIFDKPFLRRVTPQAYLGGYFDVEYRNAENADHDFRHHRFVPFIYADIHERIRFASEVEIEDGSDVGIEFAHIDVEIFRPASFRGGVILDPLGKFNLIHDSPIYDLTDRPLVNQFVIPTTLREIGVGLFGTLTPLNSAWEVTYEAYLTSGFKGLSDDPAVAPAISRASGVRGARPSTEALGTRSFGDNNNAFAGVGRVSVSPMLGFEVGASAHHGAYDEGGDNDMTIAALDMSWRIPEITPCDIPIGPIEILAEGAYAFIERDSFARARGVPDDMWGYYVQANYHFLPERYLPAGTKLTTSIFPESTFTLVGQWGQVDLDGNRMQRATVGLNFRPVESTVFKLDYQFNRGTGLAPDSADDDAFLASLASYF
ncbi:MAG TPA: DUF4148 domain-containing protein [Planctomycetota bacterium]|nr:DUF4148 domain-containing protein [Planctomycetota bacterium]